MQYTFGNGKRPSLPRQPTAVETTFETLHAFTDASAILSWVGINDAAYLHMSLVSQQLYFVRLGYHKLLLLNSKKMSAKTHINTNTFNLLAPDHVLATPKIVAFH